MISKNRISEIRKLHLKKFRDLHRLFLVEGRKSVEMLLRSDLRVRDLFVTERFREENVSLLRDVPATLVTPDEMGRISTLSTPPELLAVVEQPAPTAIQGVRIQPTISNDAIYNLSGQRVDENYKGVVIRNGKKYLQR